MTQGSVPVSRTAKPGIRHMDARSSDIIWDGALKQNCFPGRRGDGSHCSIVNTAHHRITPLTGGHAPKILKPKFIVRQKVLPHTL